jgi:hypothetical protein
MNSSYSKKRHIQEINQRLELRFLSEQQITNNPSIVSVSKYSNGTPINNGPISVRIEKRLGDGTFLGVTKFAKGVFDYYVRLSYNNNEYSVIEVSKVVSSGLTVIRFFESERKNTKYPNVYIVKDLTNNRDYAVYQKPDTSYEFYKQADANTLQPIDAPQKSSYQPTPENPKTIQPVPAKKSKFVMCNEKTGFGFGCYNPDEDKIKEVQRCLGVKDDGRWGPVTNNALKKVRTTIKSRYTLPELKGICDDIQRFKSNNQTQQPTNGTPQPPTPGNPADEFTNKIGS